MPLITKRAEVLDLYAQCAARKWVLPAFNTEHLTCTEAILAAAQTFAERRGEKRLPIIVGATNRYSHRPQTALYTQTNDWRIGLQLFLKDVAILTGPGTPFPNVAAMIHMDHIQWDADRELLDGDLSRFSSLMYDASALPLDENIRRTAAFMARHGKALVIEGACDEIGEAGTGAGMQVTTPEMAERYHRETGVDIVVANLGTEHRAGAADLRYRGDVARQIRARIGPRICLHGTSSVPAAQIRGLFDDGVCKVNIWTALERDSAPALLRDMAAHAAKIAGAAAARRLRDEGLLGPQADAASAAALAFFPTRHRQEIAFAAIREIVAGYLDLWYV